MEVPTVRYVPPSAEEAYFLVGDLVVIKATAAETAGAYSLFERWIAPGGGWPLHLHRYEDEAAVVLAGTLAVRLEGRTFETGAGGYVFVPRAVPHALTNPGPEPTRLLLLVSPGGLRELLLAELGQPVAAPAPPTGTEDRGRHPPLAAAVHAADLARIAAAAEKYGTEFLTPPHVEPRDRHERSTTP